MNFYWARFFSSQNFFSFIILVINFLASKFFRVRNFFGWKFFPGSILPFEFRVRIFYGLQCYLLIGKIIQAIFVASFSQSRIFKPVQSSLDSFSYRGVGCPCFFSHFDLGFKQCFRWAPHWNVPHKIWLSTFCHSWKYHNICYDIYDHNESFLDVADQKEPQSGAS